MTKIQTHNLALPIIHLLVFVNTGDKKDGLKKNSFQNNVSICIDTNVLSRSPCGSYSFFFVESPITAKFNI